MDKRECHKAYDMNFIAHHPKLMVDTRNAAAKVSARYRREIVKA